MARSVPLLTLLEFLEYKCRNWSSISCFSNCGVSNALQKKDDNGTEAVWTVSYFMINKSHLRSFNISKCCSVEYRSSEGCKIASMNNSLEILGKWTHKLQTAIPRIDKPPYRVKSVRRRPWKLFDKCFTRLYFPYTTLHDDSYRLPCQAVRDSFKPTAKHIRLNPESGSARPQ